MVKRDRLPRVLLYDIEMLPNIVYSWGLWDQNIQPENIIKEKSLICVAYRWLGETKVHSCSILDDPRAFLKDPYNDKVVVTHLHKIFEEADAIIAHNGDRFDFTIFNARAIKYGLPPLPTIPSVDTLKVARNKFKFNSNKLDYLGEYFGLGRKIKVDGSLWRRIAGGEVKAVREMITYNKQDVVLLEAVYMKLRPFMTNHPNLNILGGRCQELSCRICGSRKVQRRGYTNLGYAKFQCTMCQAWSKSGVVVRKTAEVLR